MVRESVAGAADEHVVARYPQSRAQFADDIRTERSADRDEVDPKFRKDTGGLRFGTDLRTLLPWQTTVSACTLRGTVARPTRPHRSTMANRNSKAKAERRAPMGAKALDVARGARGRTASSETPVHLRIAASSVAVDRTWLQQRLGFKLGKFATRLDRVDVILRDESGPKGKPTIRATLQLTIPQREPIAVTARAVTAPAAIGAALRSCERALRRSIERGETVKRRPAQRRG